MPKSVWVDLFELSALRGRRRRLLGPARYDNLRSPILVLAVHFESLAAGPGAFVRIYDSTHFRETIWWMRPNSLIESVSLLSGHEKFTGLEILDHPPNADEVGYEFFATFALATTEEH